MKIIVDCYGGDHCPVEAVAGAVAALEKLPELSVVLTGDEKEISALLQGHKYDGGRLEVVNASEVITNSDPPAKAVMRKKDSSTVVGLNLLKEGGADGMVSSANTGALLVGGSIILGLSEGVTRAALCPVLPNAKGTYTILADGGANIDCRPEQMVEFAVMGSVYMREMFKITSPSTGLLNNGAEAEKGNEQTKAAYKLLTETKGINFVGNIECRDLLTGAVDVIVADGFNGNIGIKASEGMGSVLFGLIKEGIMQGGLRAKMGYLLLKPVLKKVKNKMSSDDVGGAVFLGMKKVLVKTHGSGKAQAFMNAIIKAHGMAKSGVPAKIEDGLRFR